MTLPRVLQIASSSENYGNEGNGSTRAVTVWDSNQLNYVPSRGINNLP